jgi:hypothetical protein
MPGDHAKLQPSKAKTWLRCPGSVSLCENVVDSAGVYADEGTACHELAERALSGEDIEKLIGKKARQVDVIFTEAMLDLVRPNVEWVKDYQDATGAVLHLEQKVEIGAVFGLEPGVCFGTSDVVALSPDEMLIADHKFGYNAVEVDKNEQLILYAIGAVRKFRYRLAILQPKCGEPSEKAYTFDEITQFVEDFTPKALTAAKGGALIPGDEQCRWCKARAVCPALRDEMLALAQREWANPLVHTPEELADLLGKLSMIEAAGSALRAHAMKLIELGQEIPGWKIVRGDTKRAWTKAEKETAETLKAVGVDPFEKKLISPAGAEEQLVEVLLSPKGKKIATLEKQTKKAAKEAAKEILKALAAKPEGKPVLVPEADPRPALPPVFTAEDVGKLEAGEVLD